MKMALRLIDPISKKKKTNLHVQHGSARFFVFLCRFARLQRRFVRLKRQTS